ncbi:uncharacterized protein N0V89_006044 [Didymosphaeria variabile]|uniref:Small secreted protein n=1 Tax=Didymosphaeria variabile TaxID=1932322 RepID=A0A9W8XLV0_9PLEO|nr:uncharacterized protein N0V89_006044 [Didymosphaeria variabile]KAJ4354310.1 hypothetical protein N0V89_006044 [Didymosphaeria variabile]
MRFSASVILSGLLATGAIAAPAGLRKRGVLTAQSYADFQVSDGVAGNALAEVQAKFPIDTSDLANVDAADAKIISDARETAESAETDAFNPAIEAASGDAATALTNGKIKNKVLKLQLEVLDLQISAAQSGDDNSAKIAEEQKKLDTNIATDKKNAGQASQSVPFTG